MNRPLHDTRAFRISYLPNTRMEAYSWRTIPISLSADLARNIGVFRDRFGASGNADIIIRRFRSGAFISALMTIDGMTDTREIDENILKPCMALPPDAGEDAPAESRVDYLIENVVSVLPTEMKSNFDDLIGGRALRAERAAVRRVRSRVRDGYAWV